MDTQTQDRLEHPAVADTFQTCAGCPDQWEGRLVDGQHFYLRLRHGRASLVIHDAAASAVPQRFEVEYAPYPNCGRFDTDEDRAEVFDRLLAMQEPWRVIKGGAHI
jgi:hypothetical protein